MNVQNERLIEEIMESTHCSYYEAHKAINPSCFDEIYISVKTLLNKFKSMYRYNS